MLDMSGSRKARPVPAPGSDYSPSKQQIEDMLVMENELLKREMKDMEDRVEAKIAGALQASREETKAELKAQIAGLMDILAQGQGNGQTTMDKTTMEIAIMDWRRNRRVPRRRRVRTLILSMVRRILKPRLLMHLARILNHRRETEGTLEEEPLEGAPLGEVLPPIREPMRKRCRRRIN